MPPGPVSELVLNLTQTLLVVCCNGGLPFVDLHVWPLDGATFHNVDPTDWVATDTDASVLNATLHPEVRDLVAGLDLPPDIDLTVCDAYNLTFASPKLQSVFDQRNGTLACRCPRQFFGVSCQLRDSERVTGGPSHSFNIFLFLAIIPLSFALFAAIGGFLCKMCCCDCFGWQCDCSGKDPDGGDGSTADDANLWGENEHLDDNTYNRCVEAVRGRPVDKRLYPLSADSNFESRANAEFSNEASRCLIPNSNSQHNQYSKIPPPYPQESPPPAYKPRPSPTEPRLPRPSSIDASTQTFV